MTTDIGKHPDRIGFSSWAGRGLHLLKSNRKYIVALEVVMVVVAFLVFYLFLVRYIPGGVFSTDVLLYMNLGLNNIKDTFVLNRYVHIFLQKLFLESAATPIVGERNYWAFLVASTTALTYWNARQFFNRRSILRSLGAVLIFLSMSLFLKYSGNVIPDFSVMFMVSIYLLVYLASINRENRSKTLILLMGALFYLAFKTKETSLFPLIILLPGIGYLGDRFNLPLFKKNIPAFLIGLLVGIFSFALLSGLILKDPFWGLRGGEVMAFIHTYVGGIKSSAYSEQVNLQNWYSTFLLGSITFPFVFYIISGTAKASELNTPRRLLWLMPIAAIVFIIPAAFVDWGGRFFMPILPVISILGSGVINEDILYGNKGSLFKTSLWVFVGLVLYAGMRIGMRYVLPPLGLSALYFITVIVNPLVFTAFLGVFFLMPGSSYIKNLVLFLSLLILTISTTIINFRTAMSDPLGSNIQIEQQYQQTTYPFKAFSVEIHYSPGMHLATSTKVWASELTKNIDEFMCLFNVYFDASATRGSFIFSDDLQQLVSQARDQNFNYILITTGEWKQILSEPSLAADLQGSYRIVTEPLGKVILLTRK